MITLDSIDSALHSIQIKDAGGDALAIGADGSLNVTDNGGSLTVDAVDLDIRNLVFADDKVDVSGSSVAISGDVNVTQGTSPWVIGDGGGSITVDAVNLDIRDLSSASDSVAAVQSGTWTVAVSGDVNVTQGTSPWVVSATDLDIRDLSYLQDSVQIKDAAGDALAINADGSINAAFTEAGYASWKVSKETVTTSAAQIVSTALSGRLRIEIQNLGSQDIYIKQNNTSVLDGLKIPKGSSYEQTLDAGAAIFAITASSTSDIRIAEYAA